jgi:capsular exopolysaccharide synthesis family protein
MEALTPALEPAVRPLRHRTALSHPRTDAATSVVKTARLGPFASALEGKIVLGQATPVAVEQYRRLAATLHELQAERGVKTLMVTSAVPKEGKTLTVSNLAMTLSESFGRRVLLIDADLRRPSVHEIFGVPNTHGLRDALASATTELSLVQLSRNLTILPAGKADSNPMAGLTSERMRVLLEESSAAFDWVLLDAPPVGIMPDANLLAGLTQGVVFVVAAASTPHSVVERAIANIGRDQIVGIVLNGVEPSNITQAGYYEEYYQSVE